MSMTSRDVLFMMRARDYASREVRNVGAAFGALGKAIAKVEKDLRTNLTASTEKQTRALEHNRAVARSYSELMAGRMAAAQKTYNDNLAKSRAATAKDIEGHRKASTALANRNKEIYANNELIKSSHAPQRKAIELARQQYNAARSISRKPDATQAQKDFTNQLRRQKYHLEQGNLTWQKYIAQQKASAAVNRQEKAVIDQQIQARKRLGQAQVRQIQETYQKETSTLKEANRRKQAAFKANEQRIKSTGEAERAQYREFARQERQRLQLLQRRAAVLQGVGIAATIAGAALLAMGVKGTRALTGLVMEAAEFSHQMALVMTQIQGDTPATIESLSRIAWTVGSEIPAAMDTMGSTLYFIFSSLRADLPAAQELLRGFAREAVAGNTDIESAARSTIAILNGMQLGFEDLERVQDFQFQTVRRGVITYEQLSANIGKLIPALARAGQEIEAGGAMIAFLTRQGLSAEMATTAAARALEMIAHPRVVSRMEKLGLAITDSSGEFLPLIDILSGLNEEFSDMTAPGRAKAMWDIFGGAGYRIQARRFFDTVFKNFEEFEWHMEQQQNNAGAMRRAYEIMFAEPINQVQLLKNQYQALRQELGQYFMPILERLVEVGASIVDWFRNLDEETKSSIARFVSVAAVAAMVTGAILILGGAFLTVFGILKQVVGTTSHIFAIMLGGPGVIMAVVAALAWLVLNWDSVSESVKKAIGWLKTSEGVIFATIAAMTSLALAIKLAGGFAAAGTLIAKAFTAAKASVVAFNTTVKGAFAKSGPIGWAILAIGFLAGAFVALRQEARNNEQAIQQYADAQKEVAVSLGDSVESFKNYNKSLESATRNVAITRLENEALKDSIEIIGMGVSEFASLVSSSTAEQLRAAERYNDRMNEIAGDRSQAAADERASLQRVIREIHNSVAARKEFIEQAQTELRARGGVNELIAEYIGIQDLSNDTTRVYASRLRETIIASLELAAEMGTLDEETLNLAMSMGLVDEETGEVISSLNSVSIAAENVGSAFGDVLSLTNAWTAALEEFNEGKDEPIESLGDLSNGLELWMGSLEDSRDTARTMFTDMNTIIANNSEVMTEDLQLVIGSIFEMGEAGPQAMSLLAEADPEEFLEILRHLRLQAALTSEAVETNFDELIAGIQTLFNEYSEPVQTQWADINEALILTTSRMGGEVSGHVDGMLATVASYIQSGGQLTVEEMQEVMGQYVGIATTEGGLTAEQIDIMMDALVSYVSSGADIMSTDFGNAMHALSVYAREDGDLTVRELADALGVGIAEARKIGQDIGIKFSAAARDHLDAEGVRERWEAQLGKEIPKLERQAYLGGKSIAHNLGFGLQAVGIQMPDIRMPSNTAAVRNALRSIGRNKGGFVPGSGPNRDSVLMAATPREFVLQRKAADSFSPAFLHALNRHGADVFTKAGVGLPTGGSGAQSGSQSPGGDRIYQYMPNAKVVVQEPADIEIELARFENWLRSEQP